jgi:predicted double-glycine peptidase
MKKPLPVPFRRQKQNYTCGPVVLQMVFRYFGSQLKRHDLIQKARTNKEKGTARKAMRDVARREGFHFIAAYDGTLRTLTKYLKQGIPIIVNYIEPEQDDGHYAVVIGRKDDHIILNDPWHGPHFTLPLQEFTKRWKARGRWYLIVSPYPLN